MHVLDKYIARGLSCITRRKYSISQVQRLLKEAQFNPLSLNFPSVSKRLREQKKNLNPPQVEKSDIDSVNKKLLKEGLNKKKKTYA